MTSVHILVIIPDGQKSLDLMHGCLIFRLFALLKKGSRKYKNSKSYVLTAKYVDESHLILKVMNTTFYLVLFVL